MSEHIHTTLQEANEINESAMRGNRLIPVAAAVFAVLAAIGTLLTHHRSILALNNKNVAILLQARASDRYNAYESQSIRFQVFQALLAAGLPSDLAERKKLGDLVDKLQLASLGTQAKARDLEAQARDAEETAERYLKSYEILEVGTTFCEVSIVIVSISALAYRTWIFLTVGAVLCGTGILFLCIGLFQGP